MRKPALVVLALALAGTTAGCGIFGSDEEPGDLQVYSARHYDLEDAFAEFEDETGLKVDFLFAEDAELLQRIEAEGEESPADVFMTVDAGNLWAADEAGILEPLQSAKLDAAVPEQYRSEDGTWYGLALRARTLVYNPDNVDPSEFDTENSYAGLGDPKWKGRLCMRDSTEAYTQSLVTALMETYGEDEARRIVTSWVENDVDIMSNDILLLEAVDAGTCDVAIVNHYYLARELEENPDMDVELFWASQDGEGVQMNLSGGGVVATSDNKEQAQQLLEWLATDGQKAFIGGNHELPVNPDVAPDKAVADFGKFKPMPIDAEAYGARNAEAIELLEQVGYE
ncbi:MAG TPA: extracellular solute-binding protein [Marmoricola sp.]|nr:extracellular solute-binding protein [Marmoricola sp.]